MSPCIKSFTSLHQGESIPNPCNCRLLKRYMRVLTVPEKASQLEIPLFLTFLTLSGFRSFRQSQLGQVDRWYGRGSLQGACCTCSISQGWGWHDIKIDIDIYICKTWGQQGWWRGGQGTQVGSAQCRSPAHCPTRWSRRRGIDGQTYW